MDGGSLSYTTLKGYTCMMEATCTKSSVFWRQSHVNDFPRACSLLLSGHLVQDSMMKSCEASMTLTTYPTNP